MATRNLPRGSCFKVVSFVTKRIKSEKRRCVAYDKKQHPNKNQIISCLYHELMLYFIFLEKCGGALGIESGEIKDGQLSASSVWMGVNTFGPQHARLNNQKWPQGWSADLRDENPWLKVSLDADYVITGIATQGYGNPVFNEWVESYFVVWLDIRASEVYYREEGKVKVFIKPFLFTSLW